MNLKDTLRAKWNALSAEQQQNARKGGLIAAVLVVAFGAYYASGKDKKKVVAAPNVALVDVGDHRLQDDLRSQVERERQEERNRNEAQDKVLKATQDEVEQTEKKIAAINDAMQKLAASAGDLKDSSASAGGSPPEWPSEWQGDGKRPKREGAMVRPAVAEATGPAPLEPEWVGSIGKVSAPPSDDSGKKKGTKKYFLPVSFMQAKLLSGLKAKTVENAKSDPEPMLLRVQAPAVLPNEVRAGLDGCLVVANGFGSLASERVEARLVSLNCMDFDNHVVIAADIKGIVVDRDGVKGLAAHPVSKAGAAMARAAIAAAFQGAGNAISQSSTTVSTNPLGTTQTLNTGEIGRAALGQGLAGGANEISKVYLDLVRQSAPVLEVGPSKDVTVVVTEGVWLEVKGYEEN
jgi:conjugal transfer pilus assembly protein TraB